MEEIKYKICTKCGIKKHSKDFSDRDTAKDGKRNQCRLCILSGKKKLNICGIYKITSPTGKVYIGQSKDIKNRWSSYITRECPKQILLDRSFKKHGVHNHIFEVIEECEADDLNCRERFWQEFYDVLGRNGLNCVYVGEQREYNKTIKKSKRKSIIRDGIIDIIDLETGIFLYSTFEASLHSGIPKSHLKDMLKGKAKNKSNLIRSEDYELGFLPDNLFTPKVGKTRVKIKEGMEVIDYVTGKIIGDTAKASKELNINETTLRAYLNGYANNKTNLIYKKDYDKGLTPTDLCNNKQQEIKCINPITGEIFNSISEAAKNLNIKNCTLCSYLNNKVSHNKYPIVKFKDYDPNIKYNFDYYEINTSSVKQRIIKIIIDINTKKEFKNLKEASDYSGISKHMLSKILNFKAYNTSNLIYKEDYINGLLPNSNCIINTKNLKKVVVNIETGIEYKSIREACRHLNLDNRRESEYLKNNKLDKTILRIK